MFIKFALPLNFNLLFVEILKLNQGTVLFYIFILIVIWTKEKLLFCLNKDWNVN